MLQFSAGRGAGSARFQLMIQMLQMLLWHTAGGLALMSSLSSAHPPRGTLASSHADLGHLRSTHAMSVGPAGHAPAALLPPCDELLEMIETKFALFLCSEPSHESLAKVANCFKLCLSQIDRVTQARGTSSLLAPAAAAAAAAAATSLSTATSAAPVSAGPQRHRSSLAATCIDGDYYHDPMIIDDTPPTLSAASSPSPTLLKRRTASPDTLSSASRKIRVGSASPPPHSSATASRPRCVSKEGSVDDNDDDDERGESEVIISAVSPAVERSQTSSLLRYPPPADTDMQIWSQFRAVEEERRRLEQADKEFARQLAEMDAPHGAACAEDESFAKMLYEQEQRALELQRASEKATADFLSNLPQGFIRCPNAACGNVFECLPPDEVPSPNGANRSVFPGSGREDDEDVRRHRSRHRFRCVSCQTEFCSGCNRIPYHPGFTCAGFKSYLESAKCRYCESPVEVASADEDARLVVCNSDECQHKKSSACGRMLECGHPCHGIAGEERCLPCLHEKCNVFQQADLNQHAGDFCTICGSDVLAAGPCIQLDCKHVFHRDCVLTVLQNGHPGKRITFKYLQCSQCAQLISHESLQAELAPHIALYKEIKEKSLRRLEHDPDIPSKASLSEHDKERVALRSYSYYKCFKCATWYYGGRVECDRGAAGLAQYGNENAQEGYKAEELVCAGCSGAGKAKCERHGTEYIEFKCFYCCEKIATFFCGGRTHFCEPCHRLGFSTPVKECRGASHCMMKGKHPPNGQEYALGCVLCGNQESE